MLKDTRPLTFYKSLLPDYLRQKGINIKRNFSCLSPDHTDKNPSMNYYNQGEKVHCFGCGVSYDIFDLIGIDYGIDNFSDKIDKLAYLFGFDNNKNQYFVQAVQKDLTEKHHSDNTLHSKDEDLQRIKQNARECSYLLSRGITKESCNKYGFFRVKNREYMPIYLSGSCLGWCARAVDKNIEPRYKNSSGGVGVWNGDYLLDDNLKGDLYITEGIIDAVMIEQTGRRAISICGASNFNKLINMLIDRPKNANRFRFILCGDNDNAGSSMNTKISQSLVDMNLEYLILSLPENYDIADLYKNNRALLEEKLIDIDNTQKTSIKEYDMASVSGILDSFLSRVNLKQENPISTGFQKFDKLLNGGFYSGLYILGAISSLGKTSFMLQVADNMAENGYDVMFYSLEQSRNELMAKSLSRISAINKGPKLTQRNILDGSTPLSSSFLNAVDRYKKLGKNLFLKEGIANIGVDQIREDLRRHINARGKMPVIIIDYLQILKPANPRATDKQNTDISVIELKRISRDFGITIIAVSSFNRENYRTEVSMESFKESGAVEYSADVLMGLQLAGCGEKGFDVNKAKSREPRQIELVILKNRSGIPYAKQLYSYNAKYNYFTE